MSVFRNLPPPPSPGPALALADGDIQVLILDASPFRDPIPELYQAFDHQYEFALEKGESPNTIYVVECWERVGRVRSCKISVGMGASGFTRDSAFIHRGACIIGAGNQMLSLSLPDLDLHWVTEVDMASCFGVFHAPKHESYVSWGELEIKRISYAGKVIWSASGKDIFTNGFEILQDTIEVVDFNNERYRIDILTGKIEVT